ncbi:o-succinylbenzoate synthase [Microbacterium dextranolyticum]|uniref:o-succinylbenzoate synthase n=1 Tax=Microbacterium dextranolyticum TaxID=36806 RepID=A0A9W6HM20_9MICO|nr:o-succinylbenzoate synthase [Microbacterium dextranolyticum]MBM7464260.1 O-succinylbenzoate synthase [Microbacterium dextranolyticum]GLJ95254.1 o-succinylbenzoate synthase [Microbacterium dextranolyticum]
MRVDRVRLHRVLLPLVHEFQTSSHRKSSLEHVLVELTDESGLTGWGEIASPADPYYGSETTETALLIAERYLAPAVLGASWDTPAELEATWARIRGNEFAKAGFSIAAWDLFARAGAQPLAAALGGTRTRVDAGVSLGIEPTIPALLEQVATHVGAGYRRVKLKIAPGWDVEPVRAVRAEYPDLDVHVDANGAYPDCDESFAVMTALDTQRLTMIEQPFAPRAFATHARLQSSIDTPVCLDESVETLDDLRTMLLTGAGRILNVKVSRMGGLSVARAAHDLARDAGVPVWCGGMHEFGIGRAANVALSSLPGFTLPSDVSGSDKYYARDVILPPVIAVDGRVQVPTTPGLGHEIDLACIREHTVDLVEVDAALR